MYYIYYKYNFPDGSPEFMDSVETLEMAWQIVGNEICKAHEYSPNECASLSEFMILQNENEITDETHVFFMIPNKMNIQNNVPYIIAITECDLYYIIKK